MVSGIYSSKGYNATVLWLAWNARVGLKETRLA